MGVKVTGPKLNHKHIWKWLLQVAVSHKIHAHHTHVQIIHVECLPALQAGINMLSTLLFAQRTDVLQFLLILRTNTSVCVKSFFRCAHILFVKSRSLQ